MVTLTFVKSNHWSTIQNVYTTESCNCLVPFVLLPVFIGSCHFLDTPIMFCCSNHCLWPCSVQRFTVIKATDERSDWVIKNANFLIPQPNPIVLLFSRIVSLSLFEEMPHNKVSYLCQKETTKLVWKNLRYGEECQLEPSYLCPLLSLIPGFYHWSKVPGQLD